jgi:broad specificity phosphatase PhoE
LSINLEDSVLTVRIDWLCHAPTPAMREGAFPATDERPDDAGLTKARALAGAADRYDRVITSPAVAAVDTAGALATDFTTEAALRDIDHGRWAGRSMMAIHAEEPDLLAAWMADTSRTTPGGEPLADVVARVGSWMEGQGSTTGRVLAVAHPTIIRAAIAVALQCPVECIFSVDIVPLSRTTLSFNGKWRLQALNVELAAH